MTNYFVRYLLLLLPTILISCKDGFDKDLEREAKEFTTNRCPIEVESGTTLDSLTYDPNRRIYTSYYSLNGTNEPFYSSNASLLHQMLLQRLKSSADYKDIKAAKVTFGFIYISKTDGHTVYHTEIGPAEYEVNKQ